MSPQELKYALNYYQFEGARRIQTSFIGDLGERKELDMLICVPGSTVHQSS